MTLLQTFITDPTNRPTTVVLQSSSVQNGFPVLQHVLASEISRIRQNAKQLMLFSLLYPPEDLLGANSEPDVKVYDWLDHIPGYDGTSSFSLGDEMLAAVDSEMSKSSAPICVLIDSVDTFVSDIGSSSASYKILRDVQNRIASRPDSLLILHGANWSFLSLLVQPSFSSSLLHIRAHPPGILSHLATEYLTPPPPYSPVPKFWNVFTPLSERGHAMNEMVFGNNPQIARGNKEILLELVIRRPAGQGAKKRSVERELEAWSESRGPCEWTELECLKSITNKSTSLEPEATADPTQNVSFNLNMTTAQQEARSQVPLPYAHEGEHVKSSSTAGQGVILYDPDSADDLDDDDPDEDLDI
ncbi:hypothetical protein BKA70DRAFT_1555865 [Coprinopsis sp. MPI-PUGE-AT-0042]|nr:hypothetical protein BKA70DRAFT_1555865 [Coprinopsis sp. MPI-PUGE-AT-0042]